MFELIILCPNIKHLNPWTITYYFFSYQDLGFNSRFLIGSIFKLFSEYISSKALYYCIFLILVGMNVFVSVTLGKVLRRSDKDSLYGLKLFLFLFLASPVSLSFLFNFNNYGRLDTYLIIISVIMLILIRRKWFRWLIPILCVIAIAIHQGYVLTYMPAIAVILLYECYKNKYKKENIALCAITYLLIFVSFIYFQFFLPELKLSSAESIIDFVSHRTDFALSKRVVIMEYFVTPDDWLPAAFVFLKAFVFQYGACMLVATTPLIVIFVILWVGAYRKAKDKFAQFILCLCLASPIASLPIFIGNDWDRWIPAIFLVQFSFVFYFLDSEFSCVENSAKKILEYCDDHLLLFIIAMLFMSSIMFSDSYYLIFHLMAKVGQYLNDQVDSFHK